LQVAAGDTNIVNVNFGVAPPPVTPGPLPPMAHGVVSATLLKLDV
jgi:hypothetical protein